MSKYKVGDRVRIKTWYQMESEFEVKNNCVMCKCHYISSMEQNLREKTSDRILVIKEACNSVDGDYYYMYDTISWKWSDDMIECLEEDYRKTFIPIQIQSRFELMDFS